MDFLDRIEPLFTNVFLNIGPIKPAIPHCVFFGNILPMLRSIRGIYCDNNCVELLERHFPGALARSKELDLIDATLAGIPAYLNWLNAPQDFDVDGPRFLVVYGESMLASAIVDAVRQVFKEYSVKNCLIKMSEICLMNLSFSAISCRNRSIHICHFHPVPLVFWEQSPRRVPTRKCRYQ